MSNDKNTVEYTGADALNDALVNAGVSCVFLNSGTDYPPIIESWAKYETMGLPKPQIVISPHEIVAMSAAQGYAQISGEPQAVFVHVDVGTQNLGGTVHNAFRCRTPVFIMAGLSPHVIEGELAGGRNAYIQFIQNVGDQGGIVRSYTKLNQEYYSAQNIQQMTYRALQLAESEPKGPVYMMAAREVLEAPGKNVCADLAAWAPVAPLGLDDASIDVVTAALTGAKKPLIVTSYLGRNTAAVPELVRLAEKLAIPVIEANLCNMNFPANHPLHMGFDAAEMLKDADTILVIDSDMPWIPARVSPKSDSRIFYLDVDPVKEDIPLWYIPAERFMKADACTAIKQLLCKLDGCAIDAAAVTARYNIIADKSAKQRAGWLSAVTVGDVITPELLTKTIHEVIDDDTVILNESISNNASVERYIPRVKPGTMFLSGGSSLGWNGGAALGMKLACPEKEIIALTGDGSYVFSCPTAVHWMARKYEAPFMTVIFNNQGWNAPKQISLGEHPDGYSHDLGKFWSSFDPPAQLDMIANAAGGAFALTVSDPKELKAALQAGREAVKNGTAAVINVILPPV